MWPFCLGRGPSNILPHAPLCSFALAPEQSGCAELTSRPHPDEVPCVDVIPLVPGRGSATETKLHWHRRIHSAPVPGLSCRYREVQLKETLTHIQYQASQVTMQQSLSQIRYGTGMLQAGIRLPALYNFSCQWAHFQLPMGSFRIKSSLIGLLSEVLDTGFPLSRCPLQQSL